MYFFSAKEAKYRNGNRMNRSTKSGYWKASGSDKKVSVSSSISNKGIAGIRKSLVFYRGKSPNGTRTHWIMHEYRLVSVQTTACNQVINIPLIVYTPTHKFFFLQIEATNDES
jgi:hypothetical protein